MTESGSYDYFKSDFFNRIQAVQVTQLLMLGIIADFPDTLLQGEPGSMSSLR